MKTTFSKIKIGQRFKWKNLTWTKCSKYDAWLNFPLDIHGPWKLNEIVEIS